MTQDEIIEIYKEVSNKLCDGKQWCWAGVGEPLQMFAKLVAEHEAQRTWVGLTEDEIVLISADCAATHQHTDIHFARAIEAKLKEKNT